MKHGLIQLKSDSLMHRIETGLFKHTIQHTRMTQVMPTNCFERKADTPSTVTIRL